jgi:hypothetical protein
VKARFLRWIERVIASIRRRLPGGGSDVPDVPAPPAPPADGMPDAGRPGDYRAGFLWKPVGDHDRPAVALLPPAFTHRTKRVMQMVHDGALIETAARAHNYAVQPNGNREHYRWRMQGRHYRGPMRLAVVTLDGNEWSWTVLRPGERADGAIVPEVRRG